MTASPSPLRPSLLALLVTAAASGTLCTAAVAAAPTAVRVPLGWFSVTGVLLLSVSAFSVTWYSRTARLLRARLSGLNAEVVARDGHIARLTADANRDAAAHTAERGRVTQAHAEELERLTTAHSTALDDLTAAQLVSREKLGADLRRAESGRAGAQAAAAHPARRMTALAPG
ncbi:ATP-binding protein, partial [Streptomyces sp. NPDC059382]